MKSHLRFLFILWVLYCLPAVRTQAFLQPNRPALANFDRRQERTQEMVSREQQLAAEHLRSLLPRVKVEFDPITGAPNQISAVGEFLSGKKGAGKAIPASVAAGFLENDPYRATKGFLVEHKILFGHGPEALDQAQVKRDFITAHNGLRTVVWEQQVRGIAVFEALLISHTTRQGELVDICSHFLPNPVGAAGSAASNQPPPLAHPVVSARRATALAAANIGEDITEEQLLPAQRRQFGFA